MAEQQTATIVANYLSTVESNSESENDDYDSVIEEDFDGNEAGSEVEATASDEHDKHTAEKDSQPCNSENGDRLSEGGGSLPELLPKKGTTSEVWCQFGLRHEGGMIIEKEKPVCKHCDVNVSAKDGNTTNLHSHLKNKHLDVYATTKMKSSQPRRKSSYRDLEQPTI